MGKNKGIKINRFAPLFCLLPFAVCFGERGPWMNAFNGGEVGPKAEYRADLEGHETRCQTLENMAVWPQGAAVRRPGTKLVGPGNGVLGENANRAVTWQFVNENGTLWGLPFDSPTTIVGPDAGKRARCVGGPTINPNMNDSLWAIPCHNHPFKAGQTIRLCANGGTGIGTTAYTVQPETSAHDIVVLRGASGTFSDAPFTGQEIIVATLSLPAGTGRMVMDRAGNLYIATSAGAGTNEGVVKINYDMTTVTTDFFDLGGGSLYSTTTGLGYYEAPDGEEFLYAWGTEAQQLIKLRLDNGSMVWISDSHDIAGGEYWANYYYNTCTEIYTESHPAAAQSYQIAVDGAGNVYVPSCSSKFYMPLAGGPAGYSDAIVSRVEPHWYLEVEGVLDADGGAGEFEEGDRVRGLSSGAWATVIEVDEPLIGYATRYEITEPWGEFIDGELVVSDDHEIGAGSDVDEVPEFDDWYTACHVPYGRGVYEIVYDETLNRVIGGTAGTDYYHPSYDGIYPEINLWTYAPGGSFEAGIRLGREAQGPLAGGFYSMDEIKTGHIVTLNGAIYVLNNDESPATLYKLSPALAVLDSVAVTAEGPAGIAVDAFGQVVLVNGGGLYAQPETTFYFYDADLEPAGTLKTNGVIADNWGQYAWQKGEWVFRRPVETVRREGTLFNDAIFPMDAPTGTIRLIGYEYDGGACVLGLGDKSLSIYGEPLYWTEDFESAGFTRGGWIKTGSPIVTTLAAWPQSTGYDHGWYGARLGTGGAIEKRISTGGNENINVIFSPRYSTIYVDWSTNGTSWNRVYPPSGYTLSGAVTRALPSEASNQPNFRIRFSGGGDVDDITIFGGGKPAPPLPARAVAASPADGTTGLATGSVALSWTAAGDIDCYGVYFGTDPTPDSGEYKGLQTAAGYTVSAPTTCTTYYWRIDTLNQTGLTTGDVWNFSTTCPLPGKATLVDPTDGETGVAIDAILDWSNGVNTTSVDIYFGTTNPPPLYAQAGYAAGAWTLDAPMDYETTYYWRIDCKNAGGTTTGDVWHFTTVAESVTPPGSWSARSGAVTRYGESTLSVNIVATSDGTLTFWLKRIFNPYKVYMDFSIDGVGRDYWETSGEWQAISYPITAGPHTLEWYYSEYRTNDVDDDRAIIDLLSFPGGGDDFETGDLTGMGWTTSGDANWTVTATP
jgi:hypothetical protein